MARVMTRLLILGILLAIGIAPGLAQDDDDGLGDYAPLIAQAQQNGTVRVIVGLDVAYRPENMMTPQSAQMQQNAIQQGQSLLMQRLSTFNAQSIATYNYVPYIALTVDEAALRALIAAPEVVSIHEDLVFEPVLASSIPVIGASAAHDSGYTGAGQTIAVIDTGVEAEHDFFGGRVVHEACFSTSDPANDIRGVCPNGEYSDVGPGTATPCTDGNCEHGTHVAGIAGGSGDSFTGVAPEANIIAVQIASSFPNPGLSCFALRCGQPTLAAVLSAMEHVYTLRDTYDIAAVNLSLGSVATSSTVCDGQIPPQDAVIDLLVNAGIAVIAGSGNASNSTGMSAPACISNVVSVGASTDSDGIASFSNSTPFLDLLAPGSNIESSVPGNTFGVLSGTSMATPMVAGAWAVLRQVDPDATIREILAALQLTGEPVNDSRNGVTTPRIQLDAAVNALLNGEINPIYDVVVNEVDDIQAIELYNRSDETADLSGWTVKVYNDGGGLATDYTIPQNFTLPINGYAVLYRGTGSNTNSALYMGNYGGAGQNGGAVRLTNGQIDVDFVRWGSSTVSPQLGTSWSGINPEITLATIGRDALGTDSDNGADWTAMGATLGTVNVVVPPANDNLVNAGLITSLLFETTVNTRNATTQVGDPTPSCSPNMGKTVWYTYQPSETQLISVDTVGSDFDTSLAVYVANGAVLSELGCNDDIQLGVQQQSKLMFFTAPGQTYFIMAGGLDGASGSLYVTVDEASQKDSILGAEVISVLPFEDSLADNSEMTVDPIDPVPSCDTTSDYSLWYRYTATFDTTVQFSTAGSTYDTVLSAWTGTPGNLTEVGCHNNVNDNIFDFGNFDTTSLLDVNVTAGQTYYIMVSSAVGFWISDPIGALAFSAVNLNEDGTLIQPIAPLGIINDGYGNPTYQWTGVDSATAYEVYVALASGTQIAYESVSGGCETCSIDLATLSEDYRLYSGSYVWYVRGMDGTTAVTDWVGPVSFTLDADAPSVVTLLETTDTNTETPTFNWQLDGTAANATYFNVVLANNAGAILLNEWYTRDATCADSTDCKLDSPTLLVNASDYALYIRSYGPGGISVDPTDGDGYAGPETFDVNIPTPEPLSPEGVVDAPTGNPTYTWTAVDGASHYTLVVVDAAGDQAVNEVVEASICSDGVCSWDASTIRTSNYLTNGTFTFYVRGFVNDASTPWSEGMTFSINATPPNTVTKISPLEGGVIANPLQAQFQWSEDETATGYSLYIVQPDGIVLGPLNYYNVSCTDEICTKTMSLEEVYGTWQWYVSAFNAGGAGAWSPGGAADGYGVTAFTVPTTIPDAVTQIAPDSTVLNSNLVDFTWQHEQDATQYEVYVVGPGNYVHYEGYAVGEDLTCTTQCGLSITLGANGDYVWYVRAGSLAGWGEWIAPQADVMMFSIQADIPAVIDQNSPQPDDLLDDLTVTFDWTNDPLATVYEVYITGPGGYAYYEGYEANILNCNAICELTLTLPTNGSYTWYVRGGSAGGWGAWVEPGTATSDGITFTVDMPVPGVVTKLQPTPDALIDDLTTVFSWEPVADATWYEFYLTGPNGYVFSQQYDDLTCNPNCEITLTLPGAGAYMWYARAGNAAGGGLWDENEPQGDFGGVNFAYELPLPGVIIQDAPIDGATADTSAVTLTWQQDELATRYEVYVAGPDGFVYYQPHEASAVCPYNCTLTLELPANGSYTWYVRGGNVHGWGAWDGADGAGEAFVLAVPLPQSPILLSPGDDTLIYATNRPEFIWYLLQPATYYRLEVRDSGGIVVYDQWHEVAAICDVEAVMCSVQPETPLAFGAHQWRIQAYSLAGVGEWSDTYDLLSLSINAQPLMVQAEDALIARNGIWTTQTSQQAVGMQYLQSMTNDTLTVNFTGAAVDVVYVAGPALGTFTIEVDGVVLQTVNANATETRFGQVASVTGLSDGAHTLRIIAGAPTAIDAIVVSGQVIAAPTSPTPTQAPQVIPPPPEPTPEAEVTPEATPPVTP